MKKQDNQSTASDSDLSMLAGSLPDDEQDAPYCFECGSEDLRYLDQYANGEEWKCRNCNHTFMW